jgi:hypothetical protein
VRVSAYIDRPLDEVVGRFAEPGIDGLLNDAATRALNGRLEAHLHAGEPIWESAVHVLVPLHWTVTGPRRSDTGSGAVSLLVVRSGRQAVTELLADLPATEENRRAVAHVTRHVLDEVALLVEAAAP